MSILDKPANTSIHSIHPKISTLTIHPKIITFLAYYLTSMNTLKYKQIERIDTMEEYKLLVVFDYANGEHTITDYNELEDLAKRLNLDFETLLTDLTKSLKAESYTIMSSRLLS